jgi:hypothetical protein
VTDRFQVEAGNYNAAKEKALDLSNSKDYSNDLILSDIEINGTNEGKI